MEEGPITAAGRDQRFVQVPESSRDLRYDLFRGLALIAIFDDHIGDEFQLTWLKLVSLRPWGWSTGAELFVFISGSMFGMVYSRHLQRHGCLSMTVKSLRRATELYFANIVTLMIVLSLHLLAQRLAPGFEPNPEIRALLPPTTELLSVALSIQHIPRYFDILPLYIALVGTAPIMLMLMDHSRKWAMAVSLVVYGVVVSLARYRGTTFTNDETFQPLAWQFLFYIGALVTHVDRSGQRIRLPQNSWLTTVAVIVVTSSLFIKMLRHGSVVAHVDLSAYFPVWVQDWSKHGPPLSERVHLEPLRLLHFLSCGYLVARVTRRQSPVLRSIWVRPLVAAGANSLKVFCVGLVLTYVMTMLYGGTRHGLAFWYAIATVGVLLSLLAGLLLSWRQERPKRRVTQP